jgi:hypothetical protein
MTSNRRERFAWTLVIAIVMVATLAHILYNPIRIDHDCALYLQEAWLILHGRVLYVDVIELNPPLIVYLNAIPVAASALLRTHLIVTFLVGVWLLALASVVSTRRILRGSRNDDESVSADLMALSLAVVSAGVLLVNNYGQREHLFVLGFFPYFALRFRRWDGGRVALPWAIAVGVAAAVTACLKPHFVLIALVPDIYWLIRRRSGGPLIQPEVVAFAGTGVLYAVHFLFLPEVMRAAYFGRWIPFISQGYHAYDQPIKWMVLGEAWLWIPAALCLLVFVPGPTRTNRAWRGAEALALVALTAMLSFFVQHKGWRYQAIPAQAAAVGVLALVVGRSARSVARADASSRRLTATGFGLFAVLVAMFGSMSALVIALVVHPKSEQRLAEWTSGSPLRRAIVRYANPGDSVLFVNTDVGPAYPILTQLNRIPGSRYPTAFPIVMFYAGVHAQPGERFPYHDATTMPVEELLFRNELRTDIQRLRPRIILIREKPGCQACPEGFTVYEYLTRTGFVADALSDYRRLDSVEGYALYVAKS